MISPSKMKYRKHHKGPLPNGLDTRGTELNFGKYGVKSLEAAIIKDKQIEAIKMSAVRAIKGKGKFWVRIFPHQPYTSKGVEFSMGAGKGDVVGYQAKIRIGRIIMEIDGVSEKTARDLFRTVAHKLPVKVRFVTSNHGA